MEITRHSIEYGKRTIEFELHRKNVKNINLNVKPDMTVTVSADGQVPIDYIIDFIKGKAPWIVKNVGYFRTTQPEQYNKKEYVSGETFKYLGKQYRLKVEESFNEGVKYYQGYIYLYVTDKNDIKRKMELVTDWYKMKCEINFHESLDRVFPAIEKYGVNKPIIQSKLLKARWGSCLKDKNTIILNYSLINAPKFCIDYVVLHELTHFLYRNHNSDFYTFITAQMPDWKQRKAILDEEVVRDL